MRSFLTILTLFLAFSLFGQQNRLAQQYFRDGEYEKASVLYEGLFKNSNYNTFYFQRYIECLLALEQYDDCEKEIKKQLKRTPKNSSLYVTYGKVFERQFQDDKANEQYQKAIETLEKSEISVTRLANAFRALTKYDLAIATYERGAQLLKDEQLFAFNLGDLYRRKGDAPKMIENYLNSLANDPDKVNSLKTTFQRYLLPEDYAELQKQLYTRIQENGNAIIYPELLSWVFIQRKDYRNAFRQVKALDRRLKENGGRIYRLAEIASNDKDYDAAIMAFDYIVEEKGEDCPFYIDAQRGSLRNKRNKLVEGFDYTDEELRQLEQEYERFLARFGKSRMTAGIVLELANLEAFYLNDLDKAIELLDGLINFPGVNAKIQANAKLALADFYLMKGERWESTLLYSQVDKAYQEDILGHEARFRNAKLSYYMGDFQWAQAQFDILKASTSKLIANDALDLSVFIMDNLGLDTSVAALNLYAQADLMVFQNRFDDAFAKLDTLKRSFPEHSLEDDILYLESKIYKKQRKYSEVATALETIIEKHPDGIRADNALFELAELYETQLGDQEKAKTLYETLFIDYSGSTFAVEARKRFRILRGDTVQ